MLAFIVTFTLLTNEIKPLDILILLPSVLNLGQQFSDYFAFTQNTPNFIQLLR